MSDNELIGQRRMFSRARRLIRSWPVRWGFLAATFGLCCYAVATQWSTVRTALADLGVPVIAGALVCVLLAMIAAMQVWRVLLAGLGSPLPVGAASGIVFVGQLGKYLPGSVWPVLAQIELANEHRVPRHRSAAASLLTMVMSLLAGLVVAVAVLPFASAAPQYRWFLLALPALLVAVHPKVLNPVLRRLTRRYESSMPALRGRTVLTAFAWSTLSWLLYGAQIWLLAIRLGAPAGHAALLALGGFAFAWSVGFLVVVAPAGAGVRDALLVASLGVVLGVGDATAIALVSRVLMTVGDLLAATMAGALSRRAQFRAASTSDHQRCATRG